MATFCCFSRLTAAPLFIRSAGDQIVDRLRVLELPPMDTTSPSLGCVVDVCEFAQRAVKVLAQVGAQLLSFAEAWRKQ
jgi:hypothetical protein